MFSKIWMAMLGGAVGVGLRFCLSEYFNLNHFDRIFPWSILICNIVGSFIIGLVMGFILLKSSLSPVWKVPIATGFCGGLTTFSSFSLDTVNLFKNGMPGIAMANVAVSLIACLVATYIGLEL